MTLSEEMVDVPAKYSGYGLTPSSLGSWIKQIQNPGTLQSRDITNFTSRLFIKFNKKIYYDEYVRLYVCRGLQYFNYGGDGV